MQIVGSVSRAVDNISKEKIFNLWADVNNWHKFNHGIEYAKLEGEFKVGNYFILGLRGGQKVKIELFEVTTNQSFTDVTKFPFAKMYGIHEIIEHDGGLEIRATIKIEGILSFLWKKLVAQSVADKLGEDMDSLIALAKNEK